MAHTEQHLQVAESLSANSVNMHNGIERPEGLTLNLKRKDSDSSDTEHLAKHPKIKGVCSGSPLVWADKRQSLCSALPYYKGYQQGAYSRNRVLIGSYLDGYPADRDLIDPSGIIIMNIGGGRDLAQGGQSNKRERQRDQGEPGMLKLAVKAMAQNQYIAIVVGESCPLMPTEMPHAYNVLDWYFVTDIWCEKDKNGFKFWKMRLELTNPDNEAWWAPIDAPVVPRPSPGDFVPASQTCKVCHITSKTIFAQGWACLGYHCSECLKFEKEVPYEALEYSQEFLKQRTFYAGKVASLPDGAREFPPSIVPPIPSTGESDCGTEKHLRQGIVCPDCSGCVSRSHWAGWFCETLGCGFKLTAPMKPLDISAVHDKKIGKKKMVVDPRIQRRATKFSVHPSHEVTIYPLLDLLPAEDAPKKVVGVVAHFRASEAMKRNPFAHGPDTLFHDVHEHAAKDDWRRLPVRHKGTKHELLTSHFAQNYGAPYKYVVSVGSKSFESAPDPILRALQLLKWAGQKVMDEAKVLAEKLEEDSKVEIAQSLNFNWMEFNELLGLGYFEDDKINWHDDGEDTLGPTVATLSLGSSSVMSFRPKTKGRTSTSNGSVLDIGLGHGDMVVMHGTAIHRVYEHRVVPVGKRRFALTSRHIDLSKLETEEDRQKAIELGRIPERAKGLEFMLASETATPAPTPSGAPESSTG